MEQEHDCHVALNQTFGCTIRIVGIHLGEAADDEETYNEKAFGEDGSGFATPFCSEVCTRKGASETPNVDYDVLCMSVEIHLSKGCTHGFQLIIGICDASCIELCTEVI